MRCGAAASIVALPERTDRPRRVAECVPTPASRFHERVCGQSASVGQRLRSRHLECGARRRRSRERDRWVVGAMGRWGDGKVALDEVPRRGRGWNELPGLLLALGHREHLPK